MISRPHNPTISTFPLFGSTFHIQPRIKSLLIASSVAARWTVFPTVEEPSIAYFPNVMSVDPCFGRNFVGVSGD
jgi:hypothetical protein